MVVGSRKGGSGHEGEADHSNHAEERNGLDHVDNSHTDRRVVVRRDPACGAVAENGQNVGHALGRGTAPYP